jgi:hypothetical protein
MDRADHGSSFHDLSITGYTQSDKEINADIHEKLKSDHIVERDNYM